MMQHCLNEAHTFWKMYGGSCFVFLKDMKSGWQTAAWGWVRAGDGKLAGNWRERREQGETGGDQGKGSREETGVWKTRKKGDKMPEDGKRWYGGGKKGEERGEYGAVALLQATHFCQLLHFYQLNALLMSHLRCCWKLLLRHILDDEEKETKMQTTVSWVCF